MSYVEIDGIQVDEVLQRFIEQEAMPGTGVAPARFWSGLAEILARLGPRNRELLSERDRLQRAIDAWEGSHRGRRDGAVYEAFLKDLGYLVPQGAPFMIETASVDDEIARVAGPQLVVPVTNARYALNAANARWGSLYDALYGTDALPEDGGATRGPGYNPLRGARVIARVRQFLDQA